MAGLDALLLLTLFAATLSFVAMAIAKARRTGWISRMAHESGLRFAKDDPFNVPKRYAQFAAVRGGHSARASNVTYGQRNGWPVRAFDFRYEVGHGTSRATRKYAVIIVEMPISAGRLIMWNRLDSSQAPLDAAPDSAPVGCWSCRGDATPAAALMQAMAPLAEQGVSAQICGNLLMLCVPLRRGLDDAAHLNVAVQAAKALVGQKE